MQTWNKHFQTTGVKYKPKANRKKWEKWKKATAYIHAKKRKLALADSLTIYGERLELALNARF